jgi:hypothetical protein
MIFKDGTPKSLGLPGLRIGWLATSQLSKKKKNSEISHIFSQRTIGKNSSPERLHNHL